MSNNGHSSSQRFLPHAIRTFLWGRAEPQPRDSTGNQPEQTPLNLTEAATPPTHLPSHNDSDARSDSSMPDLLSDEWSDSDSSQDARDVEMDIVPDDEDGNWVDEDGQIPPIHSTSADQVQATDHRARVEEEVEPLPSQSNHTPNPAPPPPPHPGMRVPQPFPTLPPWNFGLGTARSPGRLFPHFPNPASMPGNANNAVPRREDTPTNSHTPLAQPPQHDRNPAPEAAQEDTREPRFHAHTFVLGMDGTGRAVPIPPGAFSALFNQFIPGMQPQNPQPGRDTNQPGENRDQPDEPNDAGQDSPFVDFVVGGILPPLFAAPGPGPQPPAGGPGNGGGPEPGRGAPAWAELLRAMLGGEPPEEKEDPERAEKLVKGLERVPVGLVKRMIRVDGVPGAHEDSTGTDSGQSPGCAICWDNLLPEEPSEKLQSDVTASTESEHPTEGPGSGSIVSDATPDEIPTAIICLPCSHVFHAACLIPWFSKPKHTTCPTCRFDIDPRNLTYTPPRRRPRPTPATTTTNATPPNDPQPNPVFNTTTATTNPSPGLPSATHQGQHHPHPPPLNPSLGGERDDRHQAETPVPNPEPFAAQPPQGPDLHRTTHRNEPPNRGDIPPIFGFGLGPQLSQLFGPPPPGQPTHGTHATAANSPRDHGDEPQREGAPHLPPLPEFPRGGFGHAFVQAPGIAVDFTLHVPSDQGLDPERISQAVRDQAAAFLRFFAGGGRGPGVGQPTGPDVNLGPRNANHEPEGPREWFPPSAPGPTLRQRVEAKERNAGLRCDDPSCGIGPSDEDPFPEAFNDSDSPSIKRIRILKDGGEVVCGHVFHPSCLVSADRCAGWGEKDRPSQGSDEEFEVVSCPVCRSVGNVPTEVWEGGAKDLLV